MRRHSLPPEQLQAKLAHVRWIGGGSGAGKSIVARRLAAIGGLRLYHSDDVKGSDILARSDPSEAPLARRFMAMDMDTRWVSRSPQVMLDTFHWFQGEGFELILEDLLALQSDRPIIAEGFKLLPRLISPLLTRLSQAVWLLPSPELRRRAFDARGSTWEIPRRTSDPERALSNLLARDELFTDQLLREVTHLGLPFVKVDGVLTADELVNVVGARLDLKVI